MKQEHTKQTCIEVTAADLPLHCPMPNASPSNSHPRVTLKIEKTGEECCPYCSTLYKFKGDLPKGHH